MPSQKRDDETQSSYVIRLILEEERERCAKIADRIAAIHSNPDLSGVAASVATAIRNKE